MQAGHPAECPGGSVKTSLHLHGENSGNEDNRKALYSFRPPIFMVYFGDAGGPI
jgi:hypothetical protein